MASLRSGFAIIGPDDMIPWRTLADPVAVSYLSPARLEALGVTIGQPRDVQDEIRSRFPAVPDVVDPAVVENLSKALRTQRIITAATENEARLTALLPKPPPPPESLQKEKEGNGEEKGGGTGGPKGGGLGGIAIEIAKAIPEFAINCFPTIGIHHPTKTTGPGLEFNRDCTLRLVNILRGGGAPTLAIAGTAAIAAAAQGALAALAAAVAAVGGWAVFVVAVCLIVFSGWLEGVVGAGGAVIHFPWWTGGGPVPYGLP